MEIIENFGVNPVLLAAQIVNFLVILFLLKKFLYKPILDLLKKRETAIKEGLKQAEEARVKLEKVVAQEKEILKNAQLASKKIIEDARNEAGEIAKQMGENTRKQTEKMVNDAKEQIARESIDTEKRLAVSVSKLAINFLEKTLKDFFSEKEQKEVLSKALKKLDKTK